MQTDSKPVQDDESWGEELKRRVAAIKTDADAAEIEAEVIARARRRAAAQ